MPSIQDFAGLLNIDAAELLKQAERAGVKKASIDEVLGDEEKKLLTPLIQKLSAEAATTPTPTTAPAKVTLTRTSKKTLKPKGSGSGVDVQIKQTKTYVKASKPEPVAETKQAAKPKPVTGIPTVQVVGTGFKPKPALVKSKLDKDAKPEKKTGEKSYVVGASAKPSKSGVSKISEAETEAPKKDGEAFGSDLANQIRKEKGGSAAPRPNRSNLSSPSRKRSRSRNQQTPQVSQDGEKTQRTYTPIVREVRIPETIIVSELADRMAIKSSEVVKLMMNLGSMVTANQVLDQATATLVVEEMGHTAVSISEDETEQQILEAIKRDGEAKKRAPVVTIMGHVDHGKTSLLDYIRNTRVTASEAGGITQHIGAYHITDKQGNELTFIDTPGHEAFTAMRARGAKITDIVVLVVAADDGVKPQTVEAIKHALAAQVPIVVAITKIDKDGSNTDKVSQELANHEIIPEAWGGSHQVVPLSSQTGEGVDKLIESIILEAEVLELQAVPDIPATGVVIESKLDKGQGPVTTVLVQNGTLKKSDIVICGLEYGKVRLLINENNQQIKEVPPSYPVQIIGLSQPPIAGDEMVVVENEKQAREISSYRNTKHRNLKIAKQQKAKLSKMYSDMENTPATSVSVLIKADVQGSVEAIAAALEKLSTDEVMVNIVSSGVGGITESDINLAIASNAFIIGFNVRAETKAKAHASNEGINIYYYSIIYEVINSLKTLMEGELAPDIKEEIVGIAEVRDVFTAPKIGQIAGCMVIEGTVKKNSPIRVLRDSVVIYEGKLESLRRFKEDVQEVKNNIECGIGVKDYNDVRPKDLIEVFEKVEVKRTIA